MSPITEFRHISALQEHRFGPSGLDTSNPRVTPPASMPSWSLRDESIRQREVNRTTAAMASLARRSGGASTGPSRGIFHGGHRHRPVGHH
jgi:hypothetical protein